MKEQFYPAMTLLEAFDQLDDGLLQQAYNTDTAEKFHALAKVRPINAKQRVWMPRLSTVAACLAVIFVLALAPWAIAKLMPMWMPTEPTEPSAPPTTGFAEHYDGSAPPKLLVYGTRQSIWPVMTGYDWYYYLEPGSTTHETAEASNPLSAEMADTIPWLTTDESTLVLKFQSDQSSIQVRCWEVGNQGNPDAYETYQVAPCSNQSVQLMPGSYIYEVNAQWYPLADRHGTATYVFGVTANFENQEPERNIVIQSGDMQLGNAVEQLNQGFRYDDAANQWVDVWGSGGYWTLVDAAQNGAPLPTLVYSGDLQVKLGANGQLTDIRVYFARDSATPGVYMFADTPEEVQGLPAGQWYILMCVTWEGRFIEHQNACESYDYEYVFMLDVPQPETPPFHWEFDEATGTLTVGGCETIPDFTYADQWTTPPWAGLREQIQHIDVADGVKRIGNMAFRDMPNLQSVTLPYGLKEIGDYAFYKAVKLEYASLPANVETIGDYAFAECMELPKFKLPAVLKHIGQGAFQFCQLPTDLILPSQLASIGDGAFQHCTGLQEVTILGSPERLRYTFQGCTGLRIIRFCGDAPASLGDLTFEDRIICYYPAQNSTWTDEILDTANLYYTAWFASNDPLSERFQEDATSGQCGRTAYWELKDGTLTISGTGDVTYMGWDLLRDQIKKVVIKDGITNIADGSFYQCGNLTSVTIPDSVTYIGFRAFYECKKLKAVTLPKNLVFIGDYAFQNCESITTIIIPEGVTAIPRMAFCGCIALKQVSFPDGLTEIVDGAFQRCTALKEVHFPASLQVLGDYAFSNCTALKKLYFYGDVPGVHNFTFEKVTATAYYPSGNESWINGGMGFHSGNIKEKPDPNQCDPHSYGDWVIIQEPNALDEGIKERVCQLCGYKDTDSVPTTVYEGTPPEHPELGEPIAGGFDHNVHWNLYADGTLTIFGTGIMEDTFQHIWIENHRAQIKRLIIDEGLASIASTAFQGLPNLVEVQLPNTLMRIGVYAFSGCIQLKSIVIPASVVEIQNYAFGRCDSLQKVYFLGDAPDMPNNIFFMDTLYVYIPADNKTWNGRRWDHGGRITWVGTSSMPTTSLSFGRKENDEA